MFNEQVVVKKTKASIGSPSVQMGAKCKPVEMDHSSDARVSAGGQKANLGLVLPSNQVVTAAPSDICSLPAGINGLAVNTGKAKDTVTLDVELKGDLIGSQMRVNNALAMAMANGEAAQTQKQGLSPTIAKKTFADVVNRGSDPAGRLNGYARSQQMQRKRGFMNVGVAGKLSYTAPISNRIVLKKKDGISVQEAWGWTLLGKFVGPIPAHVVILNVMNSWGVKAHYRIQDGWLEFVFQLEEDQAKVLLGGPYSIYGKLLFVMNVPEKFTFNKKELAAVPLWVRLKGLPKTYWTSDVIGRIASHIGRPLFLDPVTELKKRGSYARALVEINFAKPFLRSVELEFEDGDILDCDFLIENEPLYCTACFSFGHEKELCPFAAQRKRASQCNEVNNKQEFSEKNDENVKSSLKMDTRQGIEAIQSSCERVNVVHTDPTTCAVKGQQEIHTRQAGDKAATGSDVAAQDPGRPPPKITPPSVDLAPAIQVGKSDTSTTPVDVRSGSVDAKSTPTRNYPGSRSKSRAEEETLRDLFISPSIEGLMSHDAECDESEESLDDYSTGGHLPSSLMDMLFEQEVNRSQKRRSKLFDDRPVVFGLKAMSKWPSPSEAAKSRPQTRRSYRK